MYGAAQGHLGRNSQRHLGGISPRPAPPPSAATAAMPGHRHATAAAAHRPLHLLHLLHRCRHRRLHRRAAAAAPAAAPAAASEEGGVVDVGRPLVRLQVGRQD
jgi:hypothetical protein